MNIIGVDIGGTKIKVGLIKDKEIRDKVVVLTNSFDIIKQVMSLIDGIMDKNNLTAEDIDGIGIGCPGIIDDGVVVESANLQLKDFDIQETLIQQYGVRVIVKNDGDLATLGEYFFASDVNNMMLITIGTGVGGI